MACSRPLVVTDGWRHPLVAKIPAVRDGTVRACVGMRIGAPDGRVVGTLLAMDRNPRGWTAAELALLGKLCALIASEVELNAVPRALLSGVSSESVPGAWELLESAAAAKHGRAAVGVAEAVSAFENGHAHRRRDGRGRGFQHQCTTVNPAACGGQTTHPTLALMGPTSRRSRTSRTARAAAGLFTAGDSDRYGLKQRAET